MGLDTLYEIRDLEFTGDTFSASVRFDPSHPVFAGHFPGQPVVPGVALIRIAGDIANRIAGTELRLKESSNIKFLQLINPDEHQQVQAIGSFSLDDSGNFRLSAEIRKDDRLFFLFRGNYAAS